MCVYVCMCLYAWKQKKISNTLADMAQMPSNLVERFPFRMIFSFGGEGGVGGDGPWVVHALCTGQQKENSSTREKKKWVGDRDMQRIGGLIYWIVGWIWSPTFPPVHLVSCKFLSEMHLIHWWLSRTLWIIPVASNVHSWLADCWQLMLKVQTEREGGREGET